MANKTLKARVVNNNATAAQWTASNPIPLKGELCLETDTRKFKFGDGISHYNALEYSSSKMAEVKGTAPTASDNHYDAGQVWIDTSSNPKQAYILLSVVGGSASWARIITSSEGGITADIAVRLANIRTIAGHNFDGTQNIVISAEDVGAIPATDKGANGGVATLDSGGKVPQSQLPSYVDDVLEYDTLEDFPQEGETGKIYVDKATNKTHRWGGSSYVEISQSLAIGETSSTAYAGNKGKANEEAIAAHGAATDNPHDVTKEQVGLGNVDNTSDADKPISTAMQTALNGKMGKSDTVSVQRLIVESGDTLIIDGSN